MMPCHPAALANRFSHPRSLKSGLPSATRSLARLLALGVFFAAAGARGEDLEKALEGNDLAAAETELESLAADWESAWTKSGKPEDAREYGMTLQALGIIERQEGKAEEALPHLEKAVGLLEKAEPATQADALEALALTLQDIGRTADAETHLRKVVELRGSLPEAEREPGLSLGRDHLALDLLAQGKYAEAGDMLRETLEHTPADDVISRARRLGYQGLYLHTLGSHSRAVAAFREALALEFDDAELRLSLGSELALAELRLGKMEEARQGIEAAAETARTLYGDGPNAFKAAPYLNNLGALDLSLGNPLQARATFAEVLELLEQSVGHEHPSLIRQLNNLGSADQAAGNYKQAAESLNRAAALQAKLLPRLHLRVAETAGNLARNALLSGEDNAAAAVDRATGIGIELLNELIRHGSEQERLNFLQLLHLVSLPCATGDGERIENVLAATKARLLDAMLEPDAAHATEAPGWQQIQASLKPGTALVDTCRYTTVSADPEERYGAVLLLPQGPPKWVPLGSAEDLERWLDAFRKRLMWRAGEISGKSSPPPTLKLRSILRSLNDDFWEPIERELPAGTEHIAFSPDGAMHFLPLPALLNEEMAPLCTRHRQITTVTSARDLLSTPAEVKLADAPWTVLGVSTFPKSGKDPGDDRLLNLLARLDAMPGTVEETKRLREIAPKGSLFLQDDKATESALAGLSQAPGVLHLGCHAFFLAAPAKHGGMLDFDENADLLYSGGLLLHRAALRGADSPLVSPDDDLLFPAEVARLPLKGTRLVTLSSCESGAGTAVSGEGLLGLRRGFALAGAREVLVALWPVSDQSTPAFMERFYRLAIASDRTGQALWQCQREFLSKAQGEGEFETAVLRYAPFVVSQNSPLMTGGEIEAKEEEKKREIPWRMAWLVVPLGVFAAARFLRRGKARLR